MTRPACLPVLHLMRLRFGMVLLCVLAVPVAAVAQDQAVEPPAHISHVEGTAVLERDGGRESAPTSMPLLAGDRLRTENGRAEILFGDGSTLHLDQNTLVDFQSDDVIRLLEGRVRLNIVGPARDLAYRIDAPAAWVQITQPGEYRVALLPGERGPELELAVVRGAAELVNEGGRTPLRAGERAYASAGAAPSHAYVFNSAAWDSFDHWSEARRAQRLGVSAQYLPESVRPYAATLDHHGHWRHVPAHGYVWYPTVAAGWRPYYYGQWVTLRPYGWTWVGADPWAWPTHHFGRWGFSAGLWFWIPGRHWGPAWVSWAHAPGFIGWAPLGWNNRPIIQFINVNVIAGRRHIDPWRVWTVVPHRRFGVGRVNVNVVNITRIDTHVRRSFVERTTPPEIRGRAIPRSTAPIRVAGTRSGFATPRDGRRATASREITAPTTRMPSPQSETIRERRSDGIAQRGSGFPAPAREPRAPSTVRTQPRDGAPASAERGARARRPDGAAAGARERAAPDASRPVAGPSRQAAPADSRANRRSQTTAPAPAQRAVPVPSREPSAPVTAPSDRSRAVPRGDGRSSAAPPARAVQPGRTPSRSDSSSGALRAVPRSTPPAAAAPPAASRSAGGGERRAPAAVRSPGPAPSAAPASTAPARPSAGPAATPSRSSGARSAGPARSGGSSAAPARSSSRSSAAPARSPGGQSAAPARSSSGSSAAPARSSGRSGGSSAAPAGRSSGSSNAASGSRSRGGQPSSGAATRRGGGR